MYVLQGTSFFNQNSYGSLLSPSLENFAKSRFETSLILRLWNISYFVAICTSFMIGFQFSKTVIY